jgi:hypothetical protein
MTLTGAVGGFTVAARYPGIQPTPPAAPHHARFSRPSARQRYNSNKFLSRLTSYKFVLFIQGGRKMKQLDYARLAEDCSNQADAMKPGPERDALIAKAKQYRSYAKMENWIISPGLQPPAAKQRSVR